MFEVDFGTNQYGNKFQKLKYYTDYQRITNYFQFLVNSQLLLFCQTF